MINWPEMFCYAEDWANGFWTGAASASLMVMAGTAFVVLVRAIQLKEGQPFALAIANFMTDRNVMHGMALECLDVGRDHNGLDVFKVLKFGAHFGSTPTRTSEPFTAVLQLLVCGKN